MELIYEKGKKPSINNLIDYLIDCPHIKREDGEPATMKACIDHIEKFYSIQYLTSIWKVSLYPLYVKKFRELQKKNG